MAPRAFSYENATVVSSVLGADGSRQVDFVRRVDGLFSFHVQLKFEGREVWTPDPYSDSPIFDSLETAQSEAISRLPWLRAELH
jgi:hypothetical protein